MKQITIEAAKEWFINYVIENHNYSRPLAEQIANEKMAAFWDLKIDFAQSMVDKAIKEYKDSLKEHDGYYCPRCERHIEGAEVTFEENCDFCGTKCL